MSKIETRTIATICNEENTLRNCKFVIKDYQRGYRWESKQILELLNDINEFETNSSFIPKYCMQPLVVKKIDESITSRSLNDFIAPKDSQIKTIENKQTYELIDGQQRLTTALLILSRCNQKVLPYSIHYSLFRKIDEYYINNAIETIDNWFNKYEELVIDNIKSNMGNKILFALQFIWYEVESNSNSIDIFRKLNIGKIPLTNAELFKALLLNEDTVGQEYEKKILLNKVAIEWDMIEQSLRDNEFWSFISKDDADKETRIDYLLRLYALREKKNSLSYNYLLEDDPLFPFLLVCEKIKKENVDILSIWAKEIVSIHDLLKSWYTDLESYHYIGFLVQVSDNPSQCLIDLIAETGRKKKSEIKQLIQDKIRNEFRGVVIDNLGFNDKVKLRKTLLFFNIYTMIKSKTKTRFSFNQFHDMKWNIEHIHSRADEQELRQLKDFNARRGILTELRSQFISIDDNESVSDIDRFINNDLKKSTPDEFVNFYLTKVEKYGSVDTDSIGNFALLDEETNKMYHNSLFPIKRKTIIERDKGEVFIPVCTKNVFLKMYSDKVDNMLVWTVDDAQSYVNAIKQALIEEAKVCQ